MNIIKHNREAWNRESRQGSRWSTPVDPDAIRAARHGVWSVNEDSWSDEATPLNAFSPVAIATRAVKMTSFEI